MADRDRAVGVPTRCDFRAGWCEKDGGHDGDHFTTYRDSEQSARAGAASTEATPPPACVWVVEADTRAEYVSAHDLAEVDRLMERTRWRFQERLAEYRALQAIGHARWFCELPWYSRWVAMVLGR